MNKILRKFKKVLKTIINKAISKRYQGLYIEYKDTIIKNIVLEISNSTRIISPLKTLKKIEDLINSNTAGAYMRFGDGDAYLAMGINDSFQESNEYLKNEMTEAFRLTGTGIIKSLSIHSTQYGYEKEMYIGNHLVSNDKANKLISYTFPYFVGSEIYSPICLHYVATYYPETANLFLKRLKAKTKLFIGNENIPSTTIELLFGNSPHIKTPSKNSYNKIDEIEQLSIDYLNSLKEYGVVVVAMGCSGRVMMKRLIKYNYNVYFFDFGSLLDGIVGLNTRKWLTETKINYEKILENL